MAKKYECQVTPLKFSHCSGKKTKVILSELILENYSKGIPVFIRCPVCGKNDLKIKSIFFGKEARIHHAL